MPAGHRRHKSSVLSVSPDSVVEQDTFRSVSSQQVSNGSVIVGDFVEWNLVGCGVKCYNPETMEIVPSLDFGDKIFLLSIERNKPLKNRQLVRVTGVAMRSGSERGSKIVFELFRGWFKSFFTKVA